jgi:hypothetical protein
MSPIPTAVEFAPHHSQLQYDPELHRYALAGGEVLQSVTQILKAEGIQQYGPANSGTDWKMQVGTWVHKAVQWFEEGTLNEADLSEGVGAYLESYVKMKALTKFVPILPLVETPLFHSTWKYAGTPDLPGVIANRFVILDLKCGAKRAGDKIQIAAYAYLISNSVVGFEHLYPEGAIVYLDEAGNFPKIEKISVDDMIKNRSVFLAALQINRWKSSHNL